MALQTQLPPHRPFVVTQLPSDQVQLNWEFEAVLTFFMPPFSDQESHVQEILMARNVVDGPAAVIASFAGLPYQPGTNMISGTRGLVPNTMKVITDRIMNVFLNICLGNGRGFMPARIGLKQVLADGVTSYIWASFLRLHTIMDEQDTVVQHPREYGMLKDGMTLWNRYRHVLTE